MRRRTLCGGGSLRHDRAGAGWGFVRRMSGCVPMIDPRFYEFSGGATAAELAAQAGAVIARGDPSVRIRSVAQATQADEGDLTFLEGNKDGAAARIAAAACIAPPDLADAFPPEVTVISATHPRAAFAVAAPKLATPRRLPAAGVEFDPPQVSPAAILEPGVVVGPGAAIGSGARIGANSVIGPGVQIGKGSHIGPNTSIFCALIGDHVTILAGARIGETGFGLAVSPAGGVLSPHYGRVIIQDRATIGANATVDRGMFGDTVIGERAHIDNLCHIAHNVQVGAHVVMAAFAGISGSVEIGDGAMFGGRVGIADHVKIGARSRLAAGAAVMNDVPPGETHGGYPAKPMRTWMRELAWLAQQAQKRPGKDK